MEKDFDRWNGFKTITDTANEGRQRSTGWQGDIEGPSGAGL
jgi:hypothetical protein